MCIRDRYVTNAAGEILTETLPIYADKDGATKYQYRVEELDTEKTYGYQLPDPQIVELSEGEIASVSFHNVPIEIGTKATVEGEKEVDPLDKVTLTDTVSYTGLVPGKEYRCLLYTSLQKPVRFSFKGAGFPMPSNGLRLISFKSLFIFLRFFLSCDCQ